MYTRPENGSQTRLIGEKKVEALSVSVPPFFGKTAYSKHTSGKSYDVQDFVQEILKAAHIHSTFGYT